MPVLLLPLAAFAYVAITMSVICRKMGISPFLGLLCFVPGLGWVLFIGLLWYMGYGKWPRWENG